MQRPAKPRTPVRFRLQPDLSPGGGIGRRKGLKIPRKVTFVPVRFRPRATMVHMINALSLHIAFRFTRSSHFNPFAKLIQRLSVFGIALGVAVLIVISSIFNGFRIEITESLQQISPHFVVRHYDHWWTDWQSSYKTLEAHDEIKVVSPKLRTYAMIAGKLQAPPVQLIELATDDTSNDAGNNLISATISTDLQQDLWLAQDDTLSIITSIGDSKKPIGIRFRISEATNDQKNILDKRSLQTKGSTLRRALGLPSTTISELDVVTNDIHNVPNIIESIRADLPREVIIENTSGYFTSLLSSLRMQQKLMVIVLSLVVFIAAFNLVTSLVMMVTDRKKEIAQLRTIGHPRSEIIKIFVLQSILTASCGIVIGVVLGVMTATHITEMMTWCEQYLGQKIMSRQVWMLDHLPSSVSAYDVITICTGTMTLAVLSAIYPARLASRIDPAEVLRYE